MGLALDAPPCHWFLKTYFAGSEKFLLAIPAIALPNITAPEKNADRRPQPNERSSREQSKSTAGFVVPGRLWAALLNARGAFINAHTHAYHPERYYMRGPGPKCRENCKRQNQRSSAAN
jgi:hypothetical protein